MDGIVQTQKDERIKKLGAIISPTWSQKNGSVFQKDEPAEVRDIEFEISVSIVEKGRGGFGLNVLQVVKGDVSKGVEFSNVSKIKISVPVLLPAYNVEN